MIDGGGGHFQLGRAGSGDLENLTDRVGSGRVVGLGDLTHEQPCFKDSPRAFFACLFFCCLFE